MSAFALNIWHDLRERRLWPIAAAMVIALVAVPVLLIRPPEAASPESPAVLSGKRLQPLGVGDKVVLATATATLGNGSTLHAFVRRNPFRRLQQLAGGTVGLSGGGAGGAVGVSVSKPSSGSSSGQGGSSSAPTGSGPSGGGGAPSSTKPVAPQHAPPRTVLKAYVYTADLQFGLTGHERAHEGVTQLTSIPSSRTPLIVFLGVTADRGRAVFLIDTSLQLSGEGKCRPSAEKCTFLYLASGKDRDEERLVDPQGSEYTLRLDRLNRVDADSLHSGKGAGRSSRRPAFGTFGFPLVAEEQQTRAVHAAPH